MSATTRLNALLYAPPPLLAIVGLALLAAGHASAIYVLFTLGCLWTVAVLAVFKWMQDRRDRQEAHRYAHAD